MRPFMIFLLCLLAFSAQAARELRIISLQHRFADELIPALQPLVGEDGSIKAFGNQIILDAEPGDIAKVEAAVRQLDAEQRNWRINIRNDAQGWSQSRRIGAGGSIGSGRVRGQIPDERGRVPRAAAVTVDQQDRNWSQAGTMTLNVLDGSQAFISVGQQIPFTSYWASLAQHYAQVTQMVSWQEVATGFLARPRQIGDKVDIELTPRIAQLNGDGAIDFTALSTHVQVRPGEWVDLGGMLGNRDDVSRAILSQGGERGGNSLDLQLMVE